jgi:hypothetical protein
LREEGQCVIASAGVAVRTGEGGGVFVAEGFDLGVADLLEERGGLGGPVLR